MHDSSVSMPYNICSFLVSMASQVLGVVARTVAYGRLLCTIFSSRIGDRPHLKASMELLNALDERTSTIRNSPVMEPDMRLIRQRASLDIRVEYAVIFRIPPDIKATQASATWIRFRKQNPLLPDHDHQIDETGVTGHNPKDPLKLSSTLRTILSKVIQTSGPQEVISGHISKWVGIVVQGHFDVPAVLGYQQEDDIPSALDSSHLPSRIRFLTRIVHSIEIACSKFFSELRCNTRSSTSAHINALAVILFSSVNRVSARPVENGKTPSNHTASKHSIEDFAKHLLGSACLMLIVLIVPLVGPRFRFRDEVRTSTIIAFSCALSKLVGSMDSPIFWTVTASGLSIGSSFWLARMTISPTNSVLAHLLRYAIVGALVYQILCLSELNGQDADSGISAMFPELSILSSVVLNAIYNDKMRKLSQKVGAILKSMLAILGLRLVSTDGIE